MKRIVLPLALFALLSVACRVPDPTPAGSAPPAPAAAAPAQAAPAATAPTAFTLETPKEGTVVVTASDGSPALSILIDGGRVEVGSAGGERYVGEQSGDKRRYRRSSDGAAFAEVKSSDNGFKLRTPDSKLLWKVKLDDGKIKVSDNEENNSPWVLKTKYDDKVKVLDPREAEIGEVKFYAESAKVKVKDALGEERHASDTARRSAAFGVLLMSGVPAEHRGILMAEILTRGR